MNILINKLVVQTPFQMAALVDIDKMSHEDAAAKWLADNEDVWQAFTK